MLAIEGMMKEQYSLRVHKFPLAIRDEQFIGIPHGHWKPLHVAVQDRKLCIWGEVLTSDFRPGSNFVEGTMRRVMVYIRATGQEIEFSGDNSIKYLNTVIHEQFVWHVYVEV